MTRQEKQKALSLAVAFIGRIPEGLPYYLHSDETEESVQLDFAPTEQSEYQLLHRIIGLQMPPEGAEMVGRVHTPIVGLQVEIIGLVPGEPLGECNVDEAA